MSTFVFALSIGVARARPGGLPAALIEDAVAVGGGFAIVWAAAGG